MNGAQLPANLSNVVKVDYSVSSPFTQTVQNIIKHDSTNWGSGESLYGWMIKGNLPYGNGVERFSFGYNTLQPFKKLEQGEAVSLTRNNDLQIIKETIKGVWKFTTEWWFDDDQYHDRVLSGDIVPYIMSQLIMNNKSTFDHFLTGSLLCIFAKQATDLEPNYQIFFKAMTENNAELKAAADQCPNKASGVTKKWIEKLKEFQTDVMKNEYKYKVTDPTRKKDRGYCLYILLDAIKDMIAQLTGLIPIVANTITHTSTTPAKIATRCQHQDLVLVMAFKDYHDLKKGFLHSILDLGTMATKMDPDSLGVKIIPLPGLPTGTAYLMDRYAISLFSTWKYQGATPFHKHSTTQFVSHVGMMLGYYKDLAGIKITPDNGFTMPKTFGEA